MRTFVLQLIWVVATCVLTVATQALFFKTASNSWVDVLSSHLWIAVVYSIVAAAVVERLGRTRWFQQIPQASQRSRGVKILTRPPDPIATASAVAPESRPQPRGSKTP